MKLPKEYLPPLLLVCSLAGYGVIGYGINRANFGIFIAIYGLLWGGYYITIRQVTSDILFKWAIGAAILFRVILIPASPNLSDDFYRFIWDGTLLIHGFNPFAHTPVFYMQHGLPAFLPKSLFQHLNSQAYYSVYPPVSQYMYGLAALFFGTQLTGNILVMKSVMLASEIGTILVLKKLLDQFGFSVKWLLIYALNPLIILELAGNLHFEGVMIFFLLSAYYLFLKDRYWLGSVCFTLAINTKLLPLILLPYLLFSLGWKRFSGLAFVIIFGTLGLHLPFLDHAFFSHFSKSLSLYFQSFEFNASIYYVVRWLGFQVRGYDIIHTAAPKLAFLATTVILFCSWKYRQKSLHNLPVMYILFLTTYYLFSTTVHPWYISSLVALVPLAGVMFPLAWSALIPLTYITYVTPAYHENLWIVTLEYVIVFGVMVYDIYHQNQPMSIKIQKMLGKVYDGPS